MAEEKWSPGTHRRLVSGVDLAMLGVAVAWGINSSVIKAALSEWDVLSFNAIRFAASALIIFGYMVLTDREWRLDRRELGRVAVVGIIGSGMYQWFFAQGVAHTTASNAAVLINMSPLVVAVWGALTGMERLTPWVVSGALLSVVGVALVIFGKGGQTPLELGAMKGDLLSLAAMLCWAIYTIYSRPIMERVGSSLRVTAWAMLFGAGVSLVAGIPALLRQDYSVITRSSIQGLSFSVLISQVFGYLAYSWALKQVGSLRTTIYTTMTPMFAAGAAWLMLGETWTPLQWLGACFIGIGVGVPKLEG